MTRVVVSDTSPISNIALIGEMHILAELYKEILIPEAVARELRASPLVRPHLEAALDKGFLRQTPIQDQERARILQHILDEGESEAIALAQERDAFLLLIDERAGRTVAVNLGLEITGALGVLLEAKVKNHIARIEPLLTRLQAIGFRLSPSLAQQVLHVAGEG